MSTQYDFGYQTAIEIADLGRTMVRLDTWIKAARRRQDWAQVGELEERRLEVQLRRSTLMYQAWRERKGL